MGDTFEDGYANKKPVHEVCMDDFYIGKKDNPQGPSSGSSRVLRCGSWNYSENNTRAADRLRYNPGNRNSDNGFRLARTK